MALHQWFIPHKDTHKKAHLLSWEGLLIYIMIFILLQVGFSIFSYARPGVLGISSNIDQKKLIELTNIEREKKGLSPVIENEALSKAAQMKAANMLTEGYWAHFAPSGKTPWDFILGSGYKFTFAGENLAKNFSNSDEVVSAWMASPTHKDNLLNPNYHDIGMAVVEGELNGQTTTLIVQMFGTTQNLVAKPTVSVQGEEVEISPEEYAAKPDLVLNANLVAPTPPLINPYTVLKYAGFSVIGLMAVLLFADLYVLYRRRIFRISSYHVAHMALLSVASTSLAVSSPGAIL